MYILSANYKFARLLKVSSDERISVDIILKQAGQCLDGRPADGEEEAGGGGGSGASA